ncbi:transporter [Streptomyces sp. CB01881]|uniref:transporter n=1 Tax=Streptomyces sp. CB01881 TaxID=2078691 RepID=UPI000CDCAAD9|nr:transporter [Streptomyces sp. CB01881]AUY51307.1 transporter [Streptomyces sp. CB01881]TYC74694.1 transporter [Streptomyces sp. CB01881]
MSSPQTTGVRAVPTPVPDGRTVVRALVALKLRLLRNGLRRSPGRTAVYVIGAVIGLLFAALVALGMALLNGHDGAGDAGVMLTGVLAIGWAALPLFLFASDESSDPTRLTMLPLRPGPLLRGSLLAALIGPGPLVALVLLTGAALSGADGAASAVAALAGVPLAVVCLVTLSRSVAAGNARLLSSRRGKDFAIFGGLLFALLVQIANLGSQSVFGKPGEHGVDLSPLAPIASVLRWVPPVSAVDAARTAGEGRYGLALLQLATTAALLALLFRWWRASLQQLMVTADASTLEVARGVQSSRGWRFLPEGRTGAVMQRHLRYAWREPRAKAAVFTSIGMTVVLCVLSVVQGWSTVYLIAATGLFLGLQMVNLFGMDGSAFWMVAATLLTPTDARDELRGRAYAVLSYAVPVTLVLAVPLAGVTGDWAGLAPAVGLAFALLGCGIAIGAVFSVLTPYTMPADSSPMRNAAPGQSGLVMLNSFGSMFGAALLGAPVAGYLGWALVTDGPAWPVLLLGPLYGVLVAFLGLRLAAGRLLERIPEILAKTVER